MIRPYLVAMFVILSLVFIVGAASAVDFSNLAKLTDEEFVTQVKIFSVTSAELDKVLGELQRRFSNHDDRLKAIATMYLGASYYTEPFVVPEETNWMPFDKTNCTMFVLYTTAFVNSSSYEEALEHMRLLHYKGGVVEFANRWHFTSDRITDPLNKYFTNVTEKYAKDPVALSQVTVTLNKKDDGSLLFGTRLGDWTRELTVKYIPRIGFKPEDLKDLPHTIGVAFVKRSNWKIGVIVGHEGFLIDGDLYHSGSPSTGLHVIKDYLNTQYLQSGWEGMLLFTVNDVVL